MSHNNRWVARNELLRGGLALLILAGLPIPGWAQNPRVTPKPPFERRTAVQPTPAVRATTPQDTAPPAASDPPPPAEGEAGEPPAGEAGAGDTPAPPQAEPPAKAPRGAAPSRSRSAPPSTHETPAPQGRHAHPHTSNPTPDWIQNDDVVIDPTWGNWAPGCNRYWVDVEYLTWWRRGQSGPPLVTTSPSTTPSSDAGVLGVPGTSVLYGQEPEGGQARPGGRISFGLWTDDEHIQGIGARAFFLGQANAQFNASNNDIPVLARPFFEVTPGLPSDQNALLIAYPGQLTGQINIAQQSTVLGGDVYLRRSFHQTRQSRVDFVLGYQFSRIDQDLTINSSSNDGTASLVVQDSFSTTNEFHGGTLGLLFVYDRPAWRIDFLAKVGLGSMNETVTINGSQTPNTNQGGLLARIPSNIGTYSQKEFAAVPEFNLTWAWRIRDGWEFSVGYSFIYWSNVMQTGGAIDPQLAVNLSDPFTGTLRPNFAFRSEDYWVQGVSVGLGCRF